MFATSHKSATLVLGDLPIASINITDVSLVTDSVYFSAHIVTTDSPFTGPETTTEIALALTPDALYDGSLEELLSVLSVILGDDSEVDPVDLASVALFEALQDQDRDYA